MFGIGFSHILLFSVIALIVVGPEELPNVIRTLGRLLGQLKRATDDVTSAWHSASQKTQDYVRDERKDLHTTVYQAPASSALKPSSATPSPAPQPLTPVEMDQSATQSVRTEHPKSTSSEPASPDAHK